MVTTYASYQTDADVLANDWVVQASDEVLACRAQGHAWPKLRAGRLPEGIALKRERDGCYQIESTCRDCGMVRTITTLPSGMIDYPATYRYVQPDGYRSPVGSEVTRRECLAEIWRRAREDR